MTPNLLNNIRDLSPHAAFRAGMSLGARDGWMLTARLARLRGDTSRVEQAVRYARSENRSIVHELRESRRANPTTESRMITALTHSPAPGAASESP